ncbi:MAG: hypothetical protein B7O98_00160 [Zestosphaera tikiterensis]|uniref:SAM-dependent RNA methyltransferase n=1 Tax=Zestosphaera tikiterensis TaxID=1973259 RepID=A0A2R7Y8M7_9CREN|nr:MAG: hypothetical protein B7O98_00160 [Zestosphaera tikiterensis]
MFKVVVEHLEPCLSPWVLTEYSYVSEVFKGRVVFTNVVKPKHAEVLSKLGEVVSDSVTESLARYSKTIVLDPIAEEVLEPEDLSDVDYVVIGGIMGAHPPERRTWKYVTSRMPNAISRNIGPHQFTIAGAAYVVKKVEEGRRVREIPYVLGLKHLKKLSKDVELEIELPYAFPLNEHGELVLPKDYVKLIAEYMLLYEQKNLFEDFECP